MESDARYHLRCLQQLFGKARPPEIPFGVADMPAEVRKTGGRMSISGVQIKASVRVNQQKWQVEVVRAEGTHVLKPEPNEYPELPQNENLCMNVAEKLDMRVPPHGLFPMADGKLCYIVKRFDRLEDGRKIHKESMFQILAAKEKYEGSLEKAGKAIRRHVRNVGLDSIDFFERVVLCFLTGNGDMHLKNWAFLIPDNKEISLSPCYDLVCSKIYIPDEMDSALTINGKNNGLKKSDFEALASNMLIEPKSVENVFRKFLDAKDGILDMVHNSELSAGRRETLGNLILSRYDRLYKT